MKKRFISIFLLVILLISCKKNRDNEYIKIYTDTLDNLYRYALVLERIKKNNSITGMDKSLLIQYQTEITALHKKAGTFGEEYERKSEIRKKLRDILIKITIAQTHIVQMQNQIKNISGASELFSDLQSRSSE